VAPSIVVGLNAVIVAVTDEEPRLLTVERAERARAGARAHEPALPFGPLDPAGHRTLELGLRAWVREQTGLDLGYVEQLYTFADRNRDPRERAGGPRVVSIAYLALVREGRVAGAGRARWRGFYELLPWEDARSGRPALVEKVTGTSFDEAIRTDLLAPSGLDHTWAQPGEVPSGPLTVGGTTPHDDVVDPTSAVMPSVSLSSALLGAASMAADAADAAMWGYLLYGGHVIDPSLVAEMIADPQPDANDFFLPYALGTTVFTVGTDTLIGHAGGGVDYPYTSVTMVVVGDQPIGIAVLTPQAADHGSQIYDLFMQLHSIAAG